jgi:hypothetical protein
MLTRWKHLRFLHLSQIKIGPNYSRQDLDGFDGHLEFLKMTIIGSEAAHFMRDLIQKCDGTLDAISIFAYDVPHPGALYASLPSTLSHLILKFPPPGNAAISTSVTNTLNQTLSTMVNLETLCLPHNHPDFSFLSSLALLRILDLEYWEAEPSERAFQRIKIELDDLELRLKGLKLKEIHIHSNLQKACHSLSALPIAATCKRLGIDFKVVVPE